MVGSHVAEAVQVAGSLMVVLSFGIVLDLPKKYLGRSGVTGGVCQLVYLSIREEAGPPIFATFLSSLSVALLRHILARILRVSASVSLIPGILPLVPGTSIYNCVYSIICSSREQFIYYLVETMQIAGVIVVAVLFMDPMFKMIENKDKNRA